MNFLSKKSFMTLISLGKFIKYQYSVHFVYGLDKRPLKPSKQKQILELIKTHQLSHSSLIYNSSQVIKKIKSWKSKLSWIQPYYAVKSNPHKYILDDLMNQGSKFDCASKVQIQMILNMKDSNASKDIIYSNPIKQQSQLIWANQVGIKYTTADTIDELYKIQRLAPDMEILWRIAIKEEQNYFLSSKFSEKFGDDFQNENDIHKRMLQISNIGFRLKGIHFHCGSDHTGASTFNKAVKLARLCLKIGRQYGHKMDLLDIGGGFPDGEISDKLIADLIQTKNDPLGYEVIAEPGRHFSGYSSYFLTRIIGKRAVKNITNYYVNDSLYHSFKYNILDEPPVQKTFNQQFYSSIIPDINKKNQNHHIIHLTQRQNENQKSYLKSQTINLFGMTTEQNDIIARNIKVPRNLLQVGDWLCVGGMGAYIYGYHCSFNGVKTLQNVVKLSEQNNQQKIQKTENINISVETM